jgi:uncharacterized protein (DUF849 family)
MRKVIVEARINEYAPRTPNPHVPWTAAEIARDTKACVEAGASIVHFHARQADGSPAHDYESYRDPVSRIRDQVDVLIHPTLGVETASADPEQRLEHILRLAQDGLAPDFAPLDMVSMNMDMVDPVTGRFLTEDKVYVNTTATLRYFAETLRDAGVSPHLGMWNISALRTLHAFIRCGYVTPPLLITLAMAEGGALGAHPGSLSGLRAFFDFIPTEVPVTWGAALYRGDLFPLIPAIVEAGGNIWIGLGDHPYPELGFPTNAELIAAVAREVRACGAEIATVAEARAQLNRPTPAAVAAVS